MTITKSRPHPLSNYVWTKLNANCGCSTSMGKYCIPHNGGGNLGTACCFQIVGSWQIAPLAELQNEEPVGGYRIGFFIMEEPALVGDNGYIQLADKPGRACR